MEYVKISPEWVWIFNDAPSRGVREVYGEEAKELIAELEKPSEENGQKGGESDGAA